MQLLKGYAASTLFHVGLLYALSLSVEELPAALSIHAGRASLQVEASVASRQETPPPLPDLKNEAEQLDTERPELMEPADESPVEMELAMLAEVEARPPTETSVEELEAELKNEILDEQEPQQQQDPALEPQEPTTPRESRRPESKGDQESAKPPELATIAEASSPPKSIRTFKPREPVEPPPAVELSQRTPPRIDLDPRLIESVDSVAVAPSVGMEGAETDSEPTLVVNPAPIYPADALQAGLQGRVLLRVTVNANGTVDTLRVETSSGIASLDQSALQTVQRWRFKPASRLGRPATAIVLIPVRFSIRG